MFHTSHIEISKSAYKKNIKYLRKLAGEQTVISSVIKGNAYGHGVGNIVPMAEANGLSHFSVFSASEALQVCKVKSDKSNVMIMGLLDDEEIEWAIMNDVEFYVFDTERLDKAIETAKKLKKQARLHIEVETGFHRTGFDYDYMPNLIEKLKKNQQHYVFEGLCTHYAGAESIANYVRIREQIALYRKFYRYFQRHELLPLRKHTACSAAVLTYPTTIMDLVRVGIAQYGFWPSPETQMFRFRKDPQDENPLRRLISWKSRVMVVKDVEAGEFIGYGSSFLANKKTRIAIVPVGYSNGFSRSLSNMGRVLIRGKRVPVIGTVTMNTMTVNVSDIPGVERGDEVVIIGKQKRMNISVASFSEMSNELNYQTLTRIPADIPRVVVK
ncbi:MAG: alanine racemase [Bacteroidetes bacterium]|nr:MAG: alanine racemase [Bacteroidota bacterium]